VAENRARNMSQQRAKPKREPMEKHKQTPVETTAMRASKSLALALCLLGLGAVLGACPSGNKSFKVEVSDNEAMLTPMPGEGSATFTVRVVGFGDEAAAGRTRLRIRYMGVRGFSVSPVASLRTEQGHAFQFSVAYDFKEAFGRAPLLLSVDLEGMPEGYGYLGASLTLVVYILDGLQNTHPIPVHQGNIRVFNEYANTPEGLRRHYRLAENVHLTPPEAEQSNWIAIGTYDGYANESNNRLFSGSFDGEGHSISGLAIHAPEANYQGMFGATGPSAAIKNLGLDNVRVKGHRSVGGLVGRNAGGTVYNSHAGGSIAGEGEVGGLVGDNKSGTLGKSYATGSVEGGHSIGGLVGANSGEVHHSYATSSVEGFGSTGGLAGSNWSLGGVYNSYATGKVKGGGGWAIGGLVGVDNGGKIEKSYATGSVEGYNEVGGLVGQSNGTVRNSVALAPNILAAHIDIGTSIGRVVGYPSGILSDNYARGDMELYLSGTPYVPTFTTARHDAKDGATHSMFNALFFWTTLVSWDFSAQGDWEWRAGFLPILRGVGGIQNPTMGD